MDSTVEEIRTELNSIIKKMNVSECSEKYKHFSRAIAATNYILFITVIWKSFDLGSDIPVLAKISVLFFGGGILFSALLSFAEYLSESFENIPHFKRLQEMQNKYGDVLKEQDSELYRELKATNWLLSASFKQNDLDRVPKGIYQIIFSLGGVVALIVSILLLSLGLFFLAVSVFF